MHVLSYEDISAVAQIVVLLRLTLALVTQLPQDKQARHSSRKAED